MIILRGKLKIQVTLNKNNKKPIIAAYYGIDCPLLWLFGKREKMMRGMPTCLIHFKEGNREYKSTEL